MSDTFDEWRVTGKPGPAYGPYDFTWSQDRGDDNPEAAARAFAHLVTNHGWEDGPHLHRRTVTRTPWEPADRSQT